MSDSLSDTAPSEVIRRRAGKPFRAAHGAARPSFQATRAQSSRLRPRRVVDVFVMVSIVVSFAAFVTAHVALSAGLATRDPRWRGALALVIPPLAPFWGFKEKMRGRTIAWVAAGVAYVAARVAAWVIAR